MAICHAHKTVDYQTMQKYCEFTRIGISTIYCINQDKPGIISTLEHLLDLQKQLNENKYKKC